VGSDQDVPGLTKSAAVYREYIKQNPVRDYRNGQTATLAKHKNSRKVKESPGLEEHLGLEELLGLIQIFKRRFMGD
jgi:hypothetical protein